MAKKLYTGHPCLSSQFFEKRSILYVHSSTFNVSVYAPYHTAWLAILMDLPGKATDRQRRKKVARTNILKGTLVRITACSTVLGLEWYSVLNVKLGAGGGGGW